MSMDVDAPVALPSRPLIPQDSATYWLSALLRGGHADCLLEFSAAIVEHL